MRLKLHCLPFSQALALGLKPHYAYFASVVTLLLRAIVTPYRCSPEACGDQGARNIFTHTCTTSCLLHHHARQVTSISCACSWMST
jgi:hypothetical protein